MNKPLALVALLLSVHSFAQEADAGVPDAPLATPPPVAAPPVAPPVAPVPPPAPPAPSLVQSITSKWTTSLYGFVEFDGIGDSSQSFNDSAGNAALARPDTFAGSHGRMTFSVRNSRIGFKLGAPPVGSVKASAILEMDFLGNQPPGISEAALFTNPTFRIRHFLVKLETPWVDALIGQYWQLFGWQSFFHPSSVEYQGVPGQAYARSPQLRLSHRFKSGFADVEVAIAASRPPQRDSLMPDGQAGVRVLFNQWAGLHTTGSTGTSADPLALGVSGVARQFTLPEFTASPKATTSTTGWGVSIDAMVPIIRATMEDRANALTFTGSFVRGDGISDLYSGLNGGVSFPALPNPSGATPAPVYTPNIDSGLVSYDASGALHAISWQTFVVGLQYYLPPTGQLWVSANYSFSTSANAKDFGAASKVYTLSRWADVNLFFDLTPAVRLGAEYAWFGQQYADGTRAQNHRVQLAAFYLF